MLALNHYLDANQQREFFSLSKYISEQVKKIPIVKEYNDRITGLKYLFDYITKEIKNIEAEFVKIDDPELMEEYLLFLLSEYSKSFNEELKDTNELKKAIGKKFNTTAKIKNQSLKQAVENFETTYFTFLDYLDSRVVEHNSAIFKAIEEQVENNETISYKSMDDFFASFND